MLVYAKDKSGKLPRKPAKRTKPKYRDGFVAKSAGVPAFRSDVGKRAVKSAIATFLKNVPVVDSVLQVPCRTQERNEVLQLRERLEWLSKDYD